MFCNIYNYYIRAQLSFHVDDKILLLSFTLLPDKYRSSNSKTGSNPGFLTRNSPGPCIFTPGTPANLGFDVGTGSVSVTELDSFAS